MAKTTEMKLLELILLKDDISKVIEYIGKKGNFQFQSKLKEKNNTSDSEAATSSDCDNADDVIYDGLKKIYVSPIKKKDTLYSLAFVLASPILSVT